MNTFITAINSSIGREKSAAYMIMTVGRSSKIGNAQGYVPAVPDMYAIVVGTPVMTRGADPAKPVSTVSRI